MRIEEQVLSREQMTHLKALDIDTSDASMWWIAVNEGKSEEDWYLVRPNNFLMPYNTIPTYTIGDLIEKLPKDIGTFRLRIDWYNGCVEYAHWSCGEVIDCIGDFSIETQPLKDALYRCLCWVAENQRDLIK